MTIDTHIGASKFFQLLGIGYQAYFEKHRQSILSLRVGNTQSVEIRYAIRMEAKLTLLRVPWFMSTLYGTNRTEIQNMIIDTHIGAAKFLQLVGIGYRAYFEKVRQNFSRCTSATSTL